VRGSLRAHGNFADDTRSDRWGGAEEPHHAEGVPKRRCKERGNHMAKRDRAVDSNDGEHLADSGEIGVQELAQRKRFLEFGDEDDT